MKQRRRLLSGILSLLLVISTLLSAGYSKAADTIKPENRAISDLFGPNVYIFDENDSEEEIQAVIDQVYAEQEEAQFGSGRYALLFKPGSYDVRAKVGFYTHVAGLGLLPTDTVVKEFDANANWMGANSTCNFWRRAENFTVEETATWAVAQATSLRRMYFKNWLALDQWGQGWASGGFVADTVVDGSAVAYSQQQYLTRNCSFGGWSGGVWNAVFVGNEPELYTHSGAIVENNWHLEPGYEYFTVEDESPVIREQPFLTIDDNGNYGVFVPGKRENAVGVSWANGALDGDTISIDNFFVAKPTDSAATINAELASGKHLLLTPGIYSLDDSIKVNNPNTVVLGLGYATLTPSGNNACIEVADVDGVSVSGLLFDAGPEYTETLLKVGEDGASKRHAEPTLLSDLFFRVGGAATGVTQSKTCIIINSNDVIGDNFWVWRADHGDGVAWDLNKTENGVIVNGDNVTMYGLFVEHFHEYQTIWNGENGRNYFYQSEIPYDIPNQESWMSHNGTKNGYASYKVADDVTSHESYGMGVYSFNRDATVDLHSAIEVPDVEGVMIKQACSVMLAGNPGITHVVNDEGAAVSIAGERQHVVQYGNSYGVVIPPITGEEEEYEGTPGTATGANADWKNTAIVYPEAGQLVAGGPIYLSFKKFTGNIDATKYSIYVDGKLEGTVNASNSDVIEFEIYNTKVSKHSLKIVADLADGSKVTSNLRTFFVSKKGMGSGMIERVEDAALSWYYHWATGPIDAAPSKLNFVPMIWGKGSYVNEFLANPANAKYKTVLSFNEPDWEDQSDVSVDETIAAWPAFMNSGLRLGSPATAIAAPWSDWFINFMDRINADANLDLDYIAIHCYLEYADANAFIQMIDDTWNRWQKPIWITEFGVAEWNNGYWNGDDANARRSVIEFMKKVLPELDKRDYVERYAWFPFDDTDQYGGASGLYNVNTGVLNNLGQTYRNLGNPAGYVLPNLDGTVVEGSIPQDRVIADEAGNGGNSGNGEEPGNGENSGNETESANVALGKTAIASTNMGGNTANNVTDGSAETRWESEHSDNQWIYVDLGKVYDIDGVKLTWETAAGKDYTIDVSVDGTNWSTVDQKVNGNGGTDQFDFNTVNARYVRMNGTTRTTGYGFSIFEFEVYGKEASGVEIPETPSNPSVALGKIQAEDYVAMEGVGAEDCNDVDGGRNLGWIDAGDWMDYTVQVTDAGTYKMDLRVNGWNADASIKVMVNDQVLTTKNVYSNNEWATVTTDGFTLSSGDVTIRLYVENGGFNLNWFELMAQ